MKIAGQGRIFITLLLIFAVSAMRASAEPFRLGVLQGLTGVAKEDGNTVLQAVQLAVDEINAQSPNSIELKVEDDRSTASQTLISYHWLKKNGVNAIIGPTWSSTTNALAPVAAQDHLVLLNTSTLPEALNFNRAFGYLFSNALSLEGELEPFERLIKTRRPKTLIVVHTSGPWGVMLADRTQNIARRYGTAIVQTYQVANADENQDLRDAVPALKIHRADMVALALGPADTDLFLRKAAEIGWRHSFSAPRILGRRFARASLRGSTTVCATPIRIHWTQISPHAIISVTVRSRRSTPIIAMTRSSISTRPGCVQGKTPKPLRTHCAVRLTRE